MKKFLSFCCFFAVFLLCSAFSFEISVNGKNWPAPNLTVTDVPEERASGIALGELLPLFVETYSITLEFENGNFEEFSGDFSDRLFDFNLDLDVSGNPVYEGKKVSGILSEGEICTVSDNALEVWISWEGEAELKTIISGFSKVYGVPVSTLYVPNTYSKLISVMRSGGKLPDAIMVEASYISTLVESKAIQSMDYVPDPSDSSEGHFPKLKESFTLNGKNWAFPFYADTHALIYNGRLLDFPEAITSRGALTTEEMKNMCSFVATDSLIPISWNAYSGYFFIPFMMGFGKERLIESDGSIRVNDDSSIAALKYILDLKDSGTLDISERDAMTALFVEGRTAAIIGGTYMIPYLESLGMDIGVLHLPFNEETGKYVSPVLDVKGFSISRKAKNPILARRLIQYLCSEKIQEIFCGQLSKIPCRADSLKRVYGSGNYGKTLENSVINGITIPPEKIYSIYKSTLWNTLRFAITGQMNAEESLNTAQKIIDNNLKK